MGQDPDTNRHEVDQTRDASGNPLDVRQVKGAFVYLPLEEGPGTDEEVHVGGADLLDPVHVRHAPVRARQHRSPGLGLARGSGVPPLQLPEASGAQGVDLGPLRYAGAWSTADVPLSRFGVDHDDTLRVVGKDPGGEQSPDPRAQYMHGAEQGGGLGGRSGSTEALEHGNG